MNTCGERRTASWISVLHVPIETRFRTKGCTNGRVQQPIDKGSSPGLQACIPGARCRIEGINRIVNS